MSRNHWRAGGVHRAWAPLTDGKAIVAAALLVAAVGFALMFDWNWLKGTLATEASSALGREVRIEGDLDVDLGWTTAVSVGGLTIQNADWGSRCAMVRVGSIEAAVEV